LVRIRSVPFWLRWGKKFSFSSAERSPEEEDGGALGWRWTAREKKKEREMVGRLGSGAGLRAQERKKKKKGRAAEDLARGGVWILKLVFYFQI
jgi:hypothetical protein